MSMNSNLLFIVIISICLHSCGDKSITYKIPGMDDQYYFDDIKIHKGENIHNMARTETVSLDIPLCYDKSDSYTDFNTFLKDNNTLSFIIMKNDSIIYEEYFYDTLRHPRTPIFSITKSFVSTLLGIAIDEGFIESIEDPITNYIPDLYPFKDITLEMLLNMHSGLDCNMIMKDAEIYFSKDLDKHIEKYYIKDGYDSRFKYMNVNTLLLSIAIENACGINLAEYLEDKLWQRAGMSKDASWSVDCKEHNQVKGFCGINAAPIDLVRFGSLYLNEGYYNGDQIIPKEWIKESFKKQNKLKDDDGRYYSYSWRITEHGSLVAVGFLGQYVYIDPEKKMVIVRTGESYDNFDWIEFMEKIAYSVVEA